MNQKRKIQILGVLLFFFSLMFMVSLMGHSTTDDAALTSDEAAYGNPFNIGYGNPGGMMGAYLSYVAFFFFGWTAFFAALFLIVLSLKIIGWDIARRLLKHAGMAWGIIFQILMIFDIQSVVRKDYIAELPNGVGALGQTLIDLLVHLIGKTGSFLLLFASLACTLLYYASISHRFRNGTAYIADAINARLKENAPRLRRTLKPLLGIFWPGESDEIEATPTEPRRRTKISDRIKGVIRLKRKAEPEEPDAPEPARDEIVRVETPRIAGTIESQKKYRESKQRTGTGMMDESGLEGSDDVESVEFEMPSIELLSLPKDRKSAYDEKELEATAQSLRETLETFGVRLNGNIKMFPGPVITRFEVKPAAGIKVNQIANLSDDLALNLRARSIRIVAPIPGKAAVGIEIPNSNPQMVYLREILEADEFKSVARHLPIALGKDISGAPYVADLTSMPHMLIAGTTGSGKSVCVNNIITSLLYSKHPDEIKFIFIDPKMLELTVYKGIPHLEDKVVTNAKSAERVLSNVVSEMENRYRLLASAAVRSIVDFNAKQKAANKRLPYIVIVIDELADLMMSTQSSKIELMITRLAQMARAVGIHLILATQRPSVDVITGLIKANFPSRIAFQVASKTDSRTILDCNGAERLLGKGDMLFLEVGSAEPIRLHGPYISSAETEKIVEFIRDQNFSKARVEEAEVQAEEKEQFQQFNDPVLLEAVETVVQQGQASVSLLQRKLGIGYQRAARLIDDLEEMKIIGPYNESKARDVLVDRKFLDEVKRTKYAKL